MPEVPQRPPNLCAGCSHRATYYAVKKAAEGLGTIYPTDIGCYTLGVLPPLSTADFLLCMGSSVGTGCGFSAATDKKVISFIGDSTFFHSGIPGLINAVFNNHNFTLVVLDNSTTAMTGHQENPGTGQTLMGQPTYAVDLEELSRSMGIENTHTVDSYDLAGVEAALRAGTIQDLIDKSVAARRERLATRDRPLTGVTEFPDPDEQRAASPDRRAVDADTAERADHQ